MSMRIIKSFFNFVISIFKNLFNGIYAVIIFIYSLIKYFLYGIIIVLKTIFVKPFTRKNKSNNKKEKVKKITQPNKTDIKKEAKILSKQIKEQSKLGKGMSEVKINPSFNIGINDSLNTKKNEQKQEISKKQDKNPNNNIKNTHAEIKQDVLTMNFKEEDLAKSEKKQTYIYEAKDANGKLIKGKFDAFSKVDVHSFLLNEGYEIYSIKTSKWINFLYGSSSISQEKYSKKELVFFLTQLSTYLKAGISLIDSIRIFAKQEKKSGKQKILQAIVYELVMGEAFSNALEKQGKAFPRLLINMIKTAEMTGELPETLDDMAEYYGTLEKTRKQMMSAMMYPSVIFVMSIAIVAFIMLYVVPQFVGIYGNIGADIPGITKFVIDLSDFIGKYYIIIFTLMAVIIMSIIYLYKNIKLFRTMTQYILMKIPVFGKIIIYNEITIFTKTFGSLLENNVFITDSMDILSKITNNEIYKKIIYDTMNNLSKGEGISVAFKDHWAFPDAAYEMLLTGERTGELGKMMNKVSEFYQEQHTALITQMKSLIEPIMISILAFIVGGLLLAIVIPMFSLYNQI